MLFWILSVLAGIGGIVALGVTILLVSVIYTEASYKAMRSKKYKFLDNKDSRAANRPLILMYMPIVLFEMIRNIFKPTIKETKIKEVEPALKGWQIKSIQRRGLNYLEKNKDEEKSLLTKKTDEDTK